jgi:hypothetical protein
VTGPLRLCITRDPFGARAVPTMSRQMSSDGTHGRTGQRMIGSASLSVVRVDMTGRMKPEAMAA